ncbi:type III-B CRISPR module RAMP protein Cmr4 [Moorella naiadis]|uniref:type III-B CRISPR module RAMP protein Cmr4 n=1 Tax=Moorella naiadis (nom. illeg.) TaxID=3093670 RepID=UPI003D9CB8CE
MTSAILGLLAETSLHPGSGQTTGVIDLPVAREAATDYPVIVGSSMKGALRDRAEQYKQEKPGADLAVDEIFGNPNGAGALAVTDARLLLLPVRSLHGHYKWVTCPYLLERYRRDCSLAGLTWGETGEIPVLQQGQALTAAGPDHLYLEELSFAVKSFSMEAIATAVSPLIYHAPVKKRLATSMVLISDDEFAYFARYGLAVNARNVLDNDKKISTNLWYEETLPPDSLFYALLMARPGKEKYLAQLKQLFTERPYLQVGGNETVGQGWCAVTWLSEGGSER